MSDLPEPTHVDRPHPIARWRVHVPASGDIAVCREGTTVRLAGCDGRQRLTLDAASDLSAAIAAAAQWIDDQVVSAEIIDDRPRLEYRLLVEGLTQTRPSWMSDAAAHRIAEDLAGWLHYQSRVVILCDGREWTP